MLIVFGILEIKSHNGCDLYLLGTKMVGGTGIEPVTPCVSSKCSTAELTAHLFKNRHASKPEDVDLKSRHTRKRGDAG